MRTDPYFFDRLIASMRFPRRCTVVAATAAYLLVNAASAAQIGMNFVRGTNAAGTAGADFVGIQNGLPNSVAATDEAGAPGYAQTNWNNLGSRGTNIAVVDSSGASSGVLVNWEAGSWTILGSLPGQQPAPDANLMNSYLDSNGGANIIVSTNLFIHANNNSLPLIYLSGIQAWLTTQSAVQYDLVLYMDGDNRQGRTGEYWLQNASGPYENMLLGADITTRVFARDFNNFTLNPVYQQVPLTSNNRRVASSGNYLVFTGLSADSLLIRTEEFNTRVPINAIQIIPRLVASGATLDPLPGSEAFTGHRASFRVTAAGVVPMTFQWQKNGVPLSDGGNISGATTATLNIANVSATDIGNYSVIVSNASGVVVSALAPLAVIAPPAAGSYAEKIFTNNPVAYWRLNETGDPSTNNSPAYDSVGGFNGIYGAVAQNGFTGIAGPRTPEFPGFESGNLAMQTAFGNPAAATGIPYPSAYITWAVAPPLNLNTNTVTMCAWIYPVGSQAGSTAILFQRANAGSDTSGFGYGANNNLGYTWNGAGNTFGFGFGSPGYPELGLQPPSNQWSFVACVITPTNAILYLFNTNGLFSATNTVAHTNGLWANPAMIGDDPNSTGVPQNRAFNGTIDEVAVFNRSLSGTELADIYKKGLNVALIPTVIASQPVSSAIFEGRNTRFAVTASGEEPLTYQWRRNSVNLSDAGSFSGTATRVLSVNNATAGDAGSFDVVVTGGAGPVTSSSATLTIVPSNAPAPYEAKLRQSNPIAYWRLNEASGSANSFDYWGGNILANTSVTLGTPGPVPPEYSGIESTNTGGQFDGASSFFAASASLMNHLPQFSVIGWFNIPGQILTPRIGLFGQNDVIEFGFHGTANGTDGMPAVGVFTPRGSVYLNQSTNVLPGVWHLIAAVGTGTNVNLYLASTNGSGGVKVVQNSVNHAATTNYGFAQFPFRIGGGGILDATGNFFPGFIDEVAVFNRAISSSELSDLFGAALSGGDLPPTISAEPVSQTLYAGRTATFSVTALGTSPQFRWRKDGTPLNDGAGILGSGTATLTISNIAAANLGVYEVVITNRVGSVTSAPAALTIITPLPNSHESAVIALSPVSYYRLNETNDPSGGTAVVNDYWGGHNGVYGVFAQNGFTPIAGPRPSDGFNVFESSNAALMSVNPTADSYATVSAPGIANTTNLTITAWINPASYADARMGLVFARAGLPATGLNFNGQSLNYHWLDDPNTYNWNPGLIPPLNQWSFVALVVEPTQGTIYLINANGGTNAVNVLAHNGRAFTDNIRIGGDPNNNTARTFNGAIDEVAIFGYSLTPAQIQSLYLGVSSVSLSVQNIGGNVVLTWPQGTLLEANEVTGPYTTNNAASPYTNAPTAPRKFYKVIVK
jgi:hypothetical protein